jgi:hypothetical protein
MALSIMAQESCEVAVNNIKINNDHPITFRELQSIICYLMSNSNDFSQLFMLTKQFIDPSYSGIILHLRFENNILILNDHTTRTYYDTYFEKDISVKEYTNNLIFPLQNVSIKNYYLYNHYIVKNNELHEKEYYNKTLKLYDEDSYDCFTKNNHIINKINGTIKFLNIYIPSTTINLLFDNEFNKTPKQNTILYDISTDYQINNFISTLVYFYTNKKLHKCVIKTSLFDLMFDQLTDCKIIKNNLFPLLSSLKTDTITTYIIYYE